MRQKGVKAKNGPTWHLRLLGIAPQARLSAQQVAERCDDDA
jgi:hypothetical protein